MKAWGPAGGLLLALLLHLLLFPALGKKRTIDGPIKTVVIVVQENRSFDHMMGWLKRLNPDIDGVTGEEWNFLNVSQPGSPRLYFTDDSEFVDPDPGHSFQAMREQIFGSEDTSARPPPMNGFAQQAESMEEGFSKKVMSGFRPEVVPVHTALALEYAVFDKWFASVPASTQPNRFYIHSATSHGAMSNNRQDLIDGFPQKTIMESLDEAGLSFGVYYQNIPATLFFKSMRQLKYITKFHEYSLKFKLHAKLGLLPNYVIIEQRYFDTKLLPANDDHPAHDVSEGQTFLKEVYEILRSSPQWKDMLLLITYDEHGGFYDHVPTPSEDIPNPDGLIGPTPYFFKFDRLGVRVPTIMVSPWINKGTVVHDAVGPFPSSQYEHSSIAATVRKLFNLEGPPLTDRDAWAGTFEHIFRQTARTDCPETLPSPPWSLRHSAPNEEAKLTEFQQELVQLASQLNGDHTLKSYPNIGKLLNVGQANNYVQEAMSRFLDVGRMQSLQGGNATDIVRVAPSAVQVTARQPDLLRSSKVRSSKVQSSRRRI